MLKENFLLFLSDLTGKSPNDIPDAYLQANLEAFVLHMSLDDDGEAILGMMECYPEHRKKFEALHQWVREIGILDQENEFEIASLDI